MRRRTIEAATVAAAAAVLLVSALAAAGSRPALDRWALDAALDVRAGWLTDAMLEITHLGAWYATVPAAIVAAWLLLAAGHRREAIALAAGLAATIATVQLLKAAWGRERPDDALVDAVGQAYPSGHAAKAVVFVAIALAARRALGAPAAAAMLALGAVIAVLVGVSRVYLRAHLATDVLGGWAVATMAFALAAVWVRRGGRPD